MPLPEEWLLYGPDPSSFKFFLDQTGLSMEEAFNELLLDDPLIGYGPMDSYLPETTYLDYPDSSLLLYGDTVNPATQDTGSGWFDDLMASINSNPDLQLPADQPMSESDLQNFMYQDVFNMDDQGSSWLSKVGNFLKNIDWSMGSGSGASSGGSAGAVMSSGSIIATPQAQAKATSMGSLMLLGGVAAVAAYFIFRRRG